MTAFSLLLLQDAGQPQPGDSFAAALGMSEMEFGFTVGGCGLALLLFLLSIWLLVVQMKAVSLIPAANRPFPPGLVFLGLIPCFNIVWAWFLGIGIPKGLAAGFKANGIEGASTCSIAGLMMASMVLLSNVAAVGLSFYGSLQRGLLLTSQDEVIGASHFLPDMISMGLGLVSFFFFAHFTFAVSKSSKRFLT